MLSCFIVGALCNGSTTDFDSVSLGSIPNAPAKFYIAFVYWTGHVGFQLIDTGSNPVRDANFISV